jgi:hypothetical protein
VIAGSGFTGILAQHNATIGSAITEQNTAAISGNNVLQRAKACLVTTGVICPGNTAGNWLMQMAVFRDASWTVSRGWSPARQGNILYADQFPSVQAAINALPPTGGIVYLPAGSYPCPTSIPNNTAVIAHGSIFDATWSSAWNRPSIGADTQVTFTNCGAVTLGSTVTQNIRIQGVTFDFNNSGNGFAVTNATGVNLYGVSVINAGNNSTPIFTLTCASNVSRNLGTDGTFPGFGADFGESCGRCALLARELKLGALRHG